MIPTCEARYAEGHVMKTAHRTNDPFSAQKSLDALVDLIADRVADCVVERLNAAQTQEYYDQRSSPLGRRRFLEAARRGTFPTTKRGKLVLARREEVDRWINAGARTPVPPSTDANSDENSDEALLAACGIELAALPTRHKR